MGAACCGTDDINEEKNCVRDIPDESAPLVNKNENQNISPVIDETLTVSAVLSTTSAKKGDDDLHNVDFLALSEFILKKMTPNTMKRLWKHLDPDGSGFIENDEVLNALQFTAVLFVAFRYKQKGGPGQPSINKRKIKNQFRPVSEWIVREKMDAKPDIRKKEFRPLFGLWIREYAEAHSNIGNVILQESRIK